MGATSSKPELYEGDGCVDHRKGHHSRSESAPPTKEPTPEEIKQDIARCYREGLQTRVTVAYNKILMDVKNAASIGGRSMHYPFPPGVEQNGTIATGFRHVRSQLIERLEKIGVTVQIAEKDGTYEKIIISWEECLKQDAEKIVYPPVFALSENGCKK